MTFYKKFHGSRTLQYKMQNMYGKHVLTAKRDLPAEVLQQFEAGAEEVHYPDRWTRERCMFCSGYRNHYPQVAGEMVALCNVHYYTATIGSITAALRSKKEEEATNGILTEKSKAGHKKSKSGAAKSPVKRRNPGAKRPSRKGKRHEVKQRRP